MPSPELYHEEYRINPALYDHSRDTLQIFGAFHSCFRPGFVSHGNNGRYAIYSLIRQGTYISSSGKLIKAGSFSWSRFSTVRGQTTVLGNEDVLRKVLLVHQNAMHSLISSRFLPESKGFVQLTDIKAVESVFDQIYEELSGKNPDNAKLAGAFFQLLHEVASQQQQSSYSPVMNRILAYISGKLSDTELSRSTIAQHCGLSVRTLSRIFAGEMGNTVAQYIITARLTRVCSLLAVPSLQIKEIAAQCGFSTPAFMDFQFKKHYRCTPAEYRKAIAEGKNKDGEPSWTM